jgi:hypothetical protein
MISKTMLEPEKLKKNAFKFMHFDGLFMSHEVHAPDIGVHWNMATNTNMIVMATVRAKTIYVFNLVL